MVFYWIEILVLASLVTYIAAWFRYNDLPDYTELNAAKSARRKTDVLAIHGLTGHGRRWRPMFNRFLPDVAVLAPI